MTKRLTAEVEEKIVRCLFLEADALRWAHLPLGKKTEMYEKWATDPEIGGKLKDFMTLEQVRVWIKDGVMKEYARALYGEGKYAPLVPNPAASLDQLVNSALGSGWNALPGTRRIKPMRVRALKGEQTVTLTWADSAANFKHLVWAALSAIADGDQTDWVLCVVDSFESPTPDDIKKHHKRIAERCRLRVVHINP
ncbi:conserved hypothetical protein [Catenulispora acidiphila DSM 44928]|uniref:Uncharacterized protein n=1 Tax=Catenulispora acidiphila (strain DSM 44928 / JCM 14897 / NBRC 102108 / NRRL B-24433 / ID139908) TaxID=479433 RepID=C7Q8R9_CATAD|nr:hypothetical protein [Catenulispora acidiphila]ACU70334.1 conserved hypothetical protein [Catenulispora acidiphila DSM 44928]